MDVATPESELTLKTILSFGIPIAIIVVVIYFVIKSLRKNYSKKG